MGSFKPSQEIRLPLSGDVTQAINPWTWTLRMIGGQFGLINVNLGSSSDPALEQTIIEEVGSYGRQLGRIGDALAVLLRQLDRTKLDSNDLKAIDALEQQLADVKRIKEGGTTAAAPSRP